MSKNLELKKQAVTEISDKIKNSESMVVVSFSGITVEQITNLRSKFREANVDYCVLKNTLVRRALDDLKIEGMDEHLLGPSAFAFGDAVSPAKIITDFIDADKENVKKMQIKAGIIDGRAIDANEVRALSKLPSREVLIAKMMGSMNAPITNFVGVLSATLRSLVYALDSVRQQKESA
jgi:large subunit ribosomal protein L10